MLTTVSVSAVAATATPVDSSALTGRRPGATVSPSTMASLTIGSPASTSFGVTRYGVPADWQVIAGSPGASGVDWAGWQVTEAALTSVTVIVSTVTFPVLRTV